MQAGRELQQVRIGQGAAAIRPRTPNLGGETTTVERGSRRAYFSHLFPRRRQRLLIFPYHTGAETGGGAANRMGIEFPQPAFFGYPRKRCNTGGPRSVGGWSNDRVLRCWVVGLTPRGRRELSTYHPGVQQRDE